jgi:hypothetical protein
MATSNPEPLENNEVSLSLRSRYRNTRVRKDPTTGHVFFGVWRAPPVTETKPSKKHMIAPDEVYRPDLIAYREYGDASLFWAIAVRNNILFPMLDLKNFLLTNNALVIPHVDDVMSALQRSSPKSPGIRA